MGDPVETHPGKTTGTLCGHASRAWRSTSPQEFENQRLGAHRPSKTFRRAYCVLKHRVYGWPRHRYSLVVIEGCPWADSFPPPPAHAISDPTTLWPCSTGNHRQRLATDALVENRRPLCPKSQAAPKQAPPRPRTPTHHRRRKRLEVTMGGGMYDRSQYLREPRCKEVVGRHLACWYR